MSCIDFQNATSGTNKVLGDSLRQNPELLFTEFSQATKNVLENHAANVEVHIHIGEFLNMCTAYAYIYIILDLHINYTM